MPEASGAGAVEVGRSAAGCGEPEQPAIVTTLRIESRRFFISTPFSSLRNARYHVIKIEP